MNEQDRGYLLAVTPYKEHDALLSFLGKDYGRLNLILPGFYKASSKQIALGLEFSQVEYIFNYKKESLLRVKQGRLINGFRDLREDYDWLLRVSLMSEVILKLYDAKHLDFLYQIYDKAMQEKARALSVIEFLADMIELAGFSPSVSHCVHCDSSKINQFSIEEGGFLCVDHALKLEESAYLRKIYRLFHHHFTDISEEESEVFIRLLAKYLAYHSDLRFHSIALFNHV